MDGIDGTLTGGVGRQEGGTEHDGQLYWPGLGGAWGRRKIK